MASKANSASQDVDEWQGQIALWRAAQLRVVDRMMGELGKESNTDSQAHPTMNDDGEVGKEDEAEEAALVARSQRAGLGTKEGPDAPYRKGQREEEQGLLDLRRKLKLGSKLGDGKTNRKPGTSPGGKMPPEGESSSDSDGKTRLVGSRKLQSKIKNQRRNGADSSGAFEENGHAVKAPYNMDDAFGHGDTVKEVTAASASRASKRKSSSFLDELLHTREQKRKKKERSGKAVNLNKTDGRNAARETPQSDESTAMNNARTVSEPGLLGSPTSDGHVIAETIHLDDATEKSSKNNQERLREDNTFANTDPNSQETEAERRRRKNKEKKIRFKQKQQQRKAAEVG